MKTSKTPTSREEKIKILQSVMDGVPIKFALNPDRYRVLYGKPEQNFYVTADGEKVSIEEQKIFKEFFPESFVYINVSRQKQFQNRL